MFVEVDVVSAFPNSTTQDERHRAQKWTVGPERRKERATFCGRFGKRTPFLRLRAQLQEFEFNKPEFNYRMAERQKLIKISQCEIFMLRSLSPAKFIRLS